VSTTCHKLMSMEAYSRKKGEPTKGANKENEEKRGEEEERGGGRAVGQSRGVWSRGKRTHGGLRQPSERGEGTAAGFSGEKVGEGEAGDGVGTGVVV
jgi:hypothetical protein